MDDCLRCHGMHFSGPVRELVQPQNAQGPWHIIRAGFADQPTMPCQTCHQMHEKMSRRPSPPNAFPWRARRPRFAGLFRSARRNAFCRGVVAIPQLYEGPRR